MFIINTLFKPNKLGGKYLCSIRKLERNTLSSRIELLDHTEWYANRFNMEFKKGYIVIPFGSGTGFNRLRELLAIHTPANYDQIIDISIYS